MKNINSLVVCAVALLLAGCWTVSETEYPNVQVSRLAKGKNVSVAFAGFEADLQSYLLIEGHESMLTNLEDRVDGPCVKENCDTNKYYCVSSTVSRRLMNRAAEGMERKGFTILRRDANYTIELKFFGPTGRDYDALKQLGMMICTIFTAEKNYESWSAKLRVYEGNVGKKCVFEKDYTQEYTITAWGPIPIASPACHPQITDTAASSWVLTALTDCAIADASKFLTGETK